MWCIDGKAFPDDAWNDFVVVVLGWWAGSINRLVTGESVTEVLDLMDGPFSVICDSSGVSVKCRFIQRTKGDRILAEWSGKTCELANEILIVGRTVLRICHQNCWMNSDIEILERQIHALSILK